VVLVLHANIFPQQVPLHMHGGPRQVEFRHLLLLQAGDQVDQPDREG
jgi:hypothetical protein